MTSGPICRPATDILLHRSISFDGHGTSQALINLLIYLGVAAVVLIVLDLRRTEARVPADATEAAALSVPIGAVPWAVPCAGGCDAPREASHRSGRLSTSGRRRGRTPRARAGDGFGPSPRPAGRCLAVSGRCPDQPGALRVPQ
ncbi:hypothetical protein [Streptomyces massasporeus]|uniref:hypothetical protein n=1 Tax=Streptomyces massasporeus TaxID=67324 RepID=UPI0034055660